MLIGSWAIRRFSIVKDAKSRFMRIANFNARSGSIFLGFFGVICLVIGLGSL